MGSEGLPLATSTWDHAERQAILDVIESDRYTMGPKVAQFEADFARTVGARHAVMVNSGSSANLLAVAAAVLDERVDLNPGDEVLVPAVSWATTYYPLHQYGLKLVFVDIDIDTLNIDLDRAAEAVTARTRGIMAVNLLGNPNDFARLMPLVEDRELVLIEDNCESLGATYDGRSAGTFGSMGTFSSFFSHHISTMEGGLVVTDDETTAHILTSLRAHGWTRELPEVNQVFSKTRSQFDDLFRFVLPGYNVRPLEMSGAVGIEQLKKLPDIVENRRKNARLYLDVFADVPGIRTQTEQGKSSWFGFSMVLEEHLAGRRREVVEALQARGIESRPIVAGNFTRNPVIGRLNADVPSALPNADKVHDDGLFIGNHHYGIEVAIGQARDVIAGLR
jgi:CDP-4-dehydro-6-deoxyglucose reductase, E1